MGVGVVAVVVTHNRRALLAESLAAIAAQTRPPDTVVVVDNASRDGTAAFVRERYEACDLLPLRHNIGGAGGFAAGIARALELHADLVWLLDDDTVPRPTALAALLTAPDGATLVASRVLWTDGREHPMNTPRVRGRRGGGGRIRSASFVSVLVDARAIRERGLPLAGYFLWNDDFEFTTRLLRGRYGVLCPESVVVHKTAVFGSTDADPGGRFFYEVRNKVWLFTRSRGLSPVDKSLYGGATVLRWLRTFARSADRGLLARCLVRGLWAGVRRGPGDTAAILESAAGRTLPAEPPRTDATSGS